jgi:cobalamin biosynthesis Mg chelatase CobN
MGGKEVGFTREDPSEVLIQDLPNIYPYIVDDVGRASRPSGAAWRWWWTTDPAL